MINSKGLGTFSRYSNVSPLFSHRISVSYQNWFSFSSFFCFSLQRQIPVVTVTADRFNYCISQFHIAAKLVFYHLCFFKFAYFICLLTRHDFALLFFFWLVCFIDDAAQKKTKKNRVDDQKQSQIVASAMTLISWPVTRKWDYRKFRQRWGSKWRSFLLIIFETKFLVSKM